MNMAVPVIIVKRKIVDDRGSLLKFVEGETMEMILSWTREKSSMLFWRSRMFRKKSLLNSPTGLTVGAGAMGGPVAEYANWSGMRVRGGAGCRAMNEGIRMARRMIAKGTTASRYGSRQMNV